MEGLDQDRDMDVVIQSLHATIDKIVATAIRLATNNNLPGSGLPPPSVATSDDISHING
jgi:hypothetical protein